MSRAVNEGVWTARRTVPGRVANAPDLLIGIPRSGTTWLAHVLSAHPDVHLVHKPDNRELSVLAWLGTAEAGWMPSLLPHEHARDYRTMWDVAFAGGWPRHGAPGHVARAIEKTTAHHRLPLSVRASILRSSAALAARRPKPSPVVLVKSVGVSLSVPWLVANYNPTMVVVWRHPCNVVASWLAMGWQNDEFHANRPAIRRRFENTPLWPPPDDRVAGVAWVVCAMSTVLLESAVPQRRALVVHHEATTLAPRETVTAALQWLGLDWHDRVGDEIEARNRHGEGFGTHRVTREEPTRWRNRLTNGDTAAVLRMVESFEHESAVVASAWQASPATERV